MRGDWTFDLEGNLPFHTRTHETGGSASATLGYGLSDGVRVDGSVIKEKGKDLEYKVKMRIELRKDHKYWLQGHIGKDNVGARLVLNF